MRSCDRIEAVIFLRRTCPVRRAERLHFRVQPVRFVPDFPVFDIPVIPVRPAFIIVADNVLTNSGPFFRIFGRMNMIFFGRMLNSDPQPVKNRNTGIIQRFQIEVGQREIVGFLAVRICLKIRKNIGYIHIMPASVRVAGIVQTGKRRLKRLKSGQKLSVRSPPCAVIEAVNRLDFAGDVLKIRRYVYHSITFPQKRYKYSSSPELCVPSFSNPQCS